MNILLKILTLNRNCLVYLLWLRCIPSLVFMCMCVFTHTKYYLFTNKNCEFVFEFRLTCSSDRLRWTRTMSFLGCWSTRPDRCKTIHDADMLRNLQVLCRSCPSPKVRLSLHCVYSLYQQKSTISPCKNKKTLNNM